MFGNKSEDTTIGVIVVCILLAAGVYFAHHKGHMSAKVTHGILGVLAVVAVLGGPLRCHIPGLKKLECDSESN